MPNFFEHNDGFEEFLKEATDSFSMTPHARVWKSFYNNVHPQKKWPAISTKIIMIFCLFFLQGEHGVNKINMVDNVVQRPNIQVNQSKANAQQTRSTNTATRQFLISNLGKSSSQNAGLGKRLENINADKKIVHSDLLMLRQIREVKQICDPELETFRSDRFKISPVDLTENLMRVSEDESILKLDLGGKSSSNYSLQLYATPGFGYQYNTEKNEVLTNESLAANAMNGSSDKKAFSATTLNLEAGGAVTMNVSKMFRLKAGMQINFTRFEEPKSEFNAISSTHQQVDLISKIDMFQKENNPKINPDLYQISLPIGTEIKIIGNEKIQWIAGATIQPSFLMNNRDNATSSETTINKNEPFAMRRWNVNSSIETYLSYQVHPGIIINVGPQLRYQWLSTFNREIPKGIDKLYNFGLKFGISRNF